MSALDFVLIFAGLLIGSGIDAGAERFARAESFLSGPAPCQTCGRRFAWFERVPPLSWITRGGRCRSCHAPLGWSAPLTELAGALIGLSAALLAPAGLEPVTAILGWLLLALACVDLRTFLLPDLLNASVFLLGVAVIATWSPDAWLMHAAGSVLGFGTLWLVGLGYRHLRGTDGLGRGDAKLLGAIGVWVGAAALPAVLLVASLSGLAAAVLLALRNASPLSGTSAIAFGPWLALGGYAVWLYQLERAAWPV